MLNRALGQPFVFSLMVIDFILTYIFLIAFRALAFSNGVVLKVPDAAEEFHNIHLTKKFLLFLTLYFVVREVSTYISMAFISLRICLASMKDGWNIVEMVKLFCVLLSLYMIHIESSNISVLLTITGGLLWLSLLRVLKALNTHMATHILSTTFIIKDVFWFLIIISIVVAMLADMIFIDKANTPGECYIENISPDWRNGWSTNGICDPRNMYSRYITNVAVLQGDFTLTDYTYSAIGRMILITFWVFVTVIMLNVMIALVNASYIKCAAAEEKLFGSARLRFAAERICLQNALCPTERKSLLDIKWAGRVLFQFVVLGQLIVTISFVLFMVVYNVVFKVDLKSYALIEIDSHWHMYTFASIILGFILFASMLTLLYGALTKYLPPCRRTSVWKQNSERKGSMQFFWINSYDWIVSYIGYNPDQNESKDDEEDIWLVHVRYLENSIDKALKDSEQRVIQKVEATEERLLKENKEIRGKLSKV